MHWIFGLAADGAEPTAGEVIIFVGPKFFKCTFWWVTAPSPARRSRRNDDRLVSLGTVFVAAAD